MSKIKKLALGLVFFIALIILLGCFEIINPGERGIVIQLGAVQDEILDEGIHFVIPVVQKIKTIDVTMQKYNAKADAASQDLQMVYTDMTLNYHLDPTRVNTIYQTFRGAESWSLIEPSIQESIKAGTAQFTAEQLITQRASVKEVISTELKSRLEPYGIMVDGVSIVNFQFSDSFSEAIENKVVAEQNALASKNRLEQIKYEAEQKVVTAQAEAEAIKAQTEAIQSAGGDSYVQLKAIEKWNGILPTYMLSDGTMPFLTIK